VAYQLDNISWPIAATKCRSGRVILLDQNFDPPQFPINFLRNSGLGRFIGGLGNQGRAREDAGRNQCPLGCQFMVAFDGSEMQATEANGANQPAFYLIVKGWKIG
jgi:hypothetical protein